MKYRVMIRIGDIEIVGQKIFESREAAEQAVDEFNDAVNESYGLIAWVVEVKE